MSRSRRSWSSPCEKSRSRYKIGVVADPFRAEIPEHIIDGTAGGIWRLGRCNDCSAAIGQ